MALPNRPNGALSDERRVQIIERAQNERYSSKPPWYHLAKDAIPSLARQARLLFFESTPTDDNAENSSLVPKMARWAEVERDLRQTLPAEFEALDRLQRHVLFWTECDEHEIARRFSGLHSEEERLDALLGYNINLPKDVSDTHHQGRDLRSAAEILEDSDSDSDGSLMIEIESQLLSKGQRARVNQRRRKSMLRLRIEKAQAMIHSDICALAKVIEPLKEELRQMQEKKTRQRQRRRMNRKQRTLDAQRADQDSLTIDPQNEITDTPERR